MSTVYTRDSRFAYLGKVTKHGPNFLAVGGAYRRILVATLSGGVSVLQGESADLGAEPLAVASDGVPSAYYVLTPNGISVLTVVAAPVISSTVAFDTGSQKWLGYTAGGKLLSPLARGGIRLLTTGGVTNQDLYCGLAESTQGLVVGGVAYIVDGLNGRMATVTVGASSLGWEGTVAAPNCREVLRLVVDGANLFCLCRHRIVRFDITVPAAPVFAQDYGLKSTTFTDMVVMATGQYWLASAEGDIATTDPFMGPLFGAWSSGDTQMSIAAPQVSSWSVTNTTPYYTVGTLPTVGVPIVEVPGSGGGGGASVPPSGSVDELVIPTMSAVRVAGSLVNDMWLDRVNSKLYIVGGGIGNFVDASGNKARNHAGCLDLKTALWTAWAPVVSSASAFIYGDDTWIYISGPAGVNGAASGRSKRVDKVTGTTNDATWDVPDTTSDYILSDGANVWSGTHYTGSSYAAYKLTSAGALTATVVRSTTTTVGNCALYAVNSSGLGIGSAPSSVSPGPPFQAYFICRFDMTTGLLLPATYSPSYFASCRMEPRAGKIVAGGNFSEVINMSGVNVQTGLNGFAVLGENLETFYPLSTSFTSYGSARCGAVDSVTGGVFLGGEINTVGGSAARIGLFRMNTDGTLHTAFNPLWSANASPLTLRSVGGALFVGGDWSALINGATRDNFVVLSTATGALY